MPDISMCRGHGCPLKNDCYRYRAIGGQWQSYFMDSPIENDKCAYFEPIEDRRIYTLDQMQEKEKIHGTDTD